MSNERITFSIPCLMGLEKLVADELKTLNMGNVRAENARVLCTGTLADIPRLNIRLRCGERVLIQLGHFPAQDFDQLYEGTRALPWEKFIPIDGAFPVRGHSLDSKLHSIPACQSIVNKAVATRLGSAYGLTTLPETGSRYQVQFNLMKDEAYLYLDTSGDALYKRGYRAVGVEAPLRETLAAALVQLSHYRGRDPFCDPFCGSGTIAIEAALIAKNRAPGLNRTFSAQKWKNVKSDLWLDAVDEALDLEYRNRTYEIWGGDIDPNAIEIARSNSIKAEVEDTVSFEVSDAARFHWGGEYGRIVTNPPYGERLLDKQQAEALYAEFGRAADKLPDSWRLYILSANQEFEHAFGRPAAKKRKLYNGMLRCDLYIYDRGIARQKALAEEQFKGKPHRKK